MEERADLVLLAQNTLNELECLDNRGPTHEYNLHAANMRFTIENPHKFERRQHEYCIERANKFLYLRKRSKRYWARVPRSH